MIIWITFLGLGYSMWKQHNLIDVQRKVERRVPMSLAIFTFGYIIFWAGMRSGVADTATYIRMYNQYPSEISEILQYWNMDNKAPGFDTLSIMFKSLISSDYHAWFMAIAIASGVPIMLTLRKHSINFFYSAFLFIVTLNFSWMFNGIRQFMVAAILFALSDWIVERKTLKFIAAVLLLSTIHYTALVIIPVYFVVTEKPFGKKIILFLIVLLMCIVFIEPFVETLEMSLSDTAYSGFTEQFATDDGVNPIRVLVMLLPSVIAFVGRKRLECINDEYVNLSVNMSFVSASIYFLGVFTSGILIGRLPIYFELYNLILIPYLLKKCFTRDSSKIMFLLYTIGFLMFYMLVNGGSYYISDITGLIE